MLKVVTLGILKGQRPPAPLQGLYDRDLSEASLAAARAIADLQEQREPWNGVVPHEAAAEPTGRPQPHRIIAVSAVKSMLLALHDAAAPDCKLTNFDASLMFLLSTVMLTVPHQQSC